MGAANLTEIAASIGAVGASLATWRTVVLSKRIQEVHVLVNSQLSEVMAKLAAMTAERNALSEQVLRDDAERNASSDQIIRDDAGG